MLKLILRRLLISIPLLLAVSIITFFFEAFVPGDPARSLLGVNASAAQYEALRKALHLNLPIIDQYWIYLDGVLHGNLGTSIFTGQSVVSTLAQRLPVTLSAIAGATLLATVAGVVLGVLSATRGRIARRVVDVIAPVGAALPAFWVGLVLAAIFAVSLRLLPATGYTPFAQSPIHWLLSLILPVITLALYGIAVVSRVTRDGMMSALGMDYIRTLRACGVPERRLIWKHALRNTGIPLLTVIGVVFVGSLSGVVMVETVFVLPGLGALAVTATNEHDIPVIQGIALAFTLIVIAVNLLIDIAYSLIDPRVRVS